MVVQIKSHHTQTTFSNTTEPDFTHIPIKECKIQLCKLSNIRDFIEKWHYSNNVNGLNHSYCFKMRYNDNMIGAAIYGRIGMANVWKKYADNLNDIVELKRLCCVDKTKKNAESRLIGQSLRWLKNNTKIKRVISYADPFYGHDGKIYQATNFTYIGQTSPGKVISYNGKYYHDKAIRNYYNNKLKPFSKQLKEALEEGKAKYIKTPGKHIYIYEFSRRPNYIN